MNIPATTVVIQTLGRFDISMGGKSVAIDWPDETVKVLFCSLLSPLDLYFTWDRICRAILGGTETRSNRRQLEERFIRPLNHFLVKEIGFNPLVVEAEGIRIAPQGLSIDAFEFHRVVVEGLSLMATGKLDGAREKFTRANHLYAGSYLPGVPGKIIENTRNEFESLYRTTVRDGIWQTRIHLYPVKSVRASQSKAELRSS